jgi:hypothetical protein
MLDADYRKMIVDSAIEGLIQGGWNELEAKCLTHLLERVYTSGYNEARREAQEIKDWGAY